MADITREQARLLALLEGLQQLARSDAAEAIPRERANLSEVVDAAVANANARYPDATITFTGPDDVVLHGWPDGLRLLIDNRLLRRPARSVPRSWSGMLINSSTGRGPARMLSNRSPDLCHEVRRKPQSRRPTPPARAAPADNSARS